jgi:hypothetical protein
MELISILSSLLGVVIPLSIFFIFDLRSKNKNLKLKIDTLESEYRHRENQKIGEIIKLKQKIISLQNRNLCVGAIFYYPEGFNFKDELIGKRTKIVEIDDDHIKSRLIGDEGEFIDDIVWEGSKSSALNYFYESSNNNLMFKFN